MNFDYACTWSNQWGWIYIRSFDKLMVHRHSHAPWKIWKLTFCYLLQTYIPWTPVIRNQFKEIISSICRHTNSGTMHQYLVLVCIRQLIVRDLIVYADFFLCVQKECLYICLEKCYMDIPITYWTSRKRKKNIDLM